MSPCRLAAALAFAVALVGITGCTGVSYVLQAGCGQLDISLASRSIDAVIADPGTPPRTAALLSQVASMKQFGERNGLKPTANYGQYANLGRPAAVWVVTASEPLRFRLKTWTFPVVGSVTYLGWFERSDADFFASELEDDGWDVDVRGASAYSTLGWFHDPVLSTMIAPGPEAVGELANTVLHESVHATIYFAGQTVFNESVASFIGDALAEAYLDERAGPTSPEKEAYMAGEVAGERRRRAMHEAYLKLDRLYASAASDADKLAEKARIMAALRAEIGFRRRITNATLAQFKAYNSNKVDLGALLGACGGSFPKMVAALKGIAPSSFAGPQDRDIGRVIEPLLRAGCRMHG